MAKPRNEPVPVDVYIQFVRSLFDNVQMVLVGACLHAIVATLAYWNTKQPVYAVLAGLLFLVGVWRYAGMRHFHKVGEITTAEAAAQWELDYVIKGSIQGLALGSFCFISIYLVPDNFAEIGAVSVTLGSIVTVAGRNYGSPRMVMIFAITFVAPISLGLIMRLDIPNVVLGLLIVPFYFIIKGTADRVRDVLFSAVTGHKQARQIAQRFDRALNTMSHGLIMLSADGRVVVANAEANDALLGRTLKALVMRAVASGMLGTKEGRYLETQLTRALREGRDRKILVPLLNGRHLEFSASEGVGGLGVITFEDVSQRIEAEEKIRSMARYDSLTGLANRAYFHELVAEMMATGDPERSCSLVVFDLDDFKSVNDTLGHPIGDGLIYAVAERLQAFASSEVKISRFGGD